MIEGKKSGLQSFIRESKETDIGCRLSVQSFGIVPFLCDMIDRILHAVDPLNNKFCPGKDQSAKMVWTKSWLWSAGLEKKELGSISDQFSFALRHKLWIYDSLSFLRTISPISGKHKVQKSCRIGPKKSGFCAWGSSMSSWIMNHISPES